MRTFRICYFSMLILFTPLLILRLWGCSMSKPGLRSSRPDYKRCITDRLRGLNEQEKSVLQPQYNDGIYYLVLWAGPPFPGEKERIHKIRDSLEKKSMKLIVKYEGHASMNGPVEYLDQVYLRDYYRKQDSISLMENLYQECGEELKEFLEDSTGYSLATDAISRGDSIEISYEKFIYTELNKQVLLSRDFIQNLGPLHTYLSNQN